MRGADRNGKRVDIRRLDEASDLVGFGEDVFALHGRFKIRAADVPQFGLDADAVGMGDLDSRARDCRVLFKRKHRAVDHDGREAQFDRPANRIEFNRMVKVQDDRNRVAAGDGLDETGKIVPTSATTRLEVGRRHIR